MGALLIFQGRGPVEMCGVANKTCVLKGYINPLLYQFTSSALKMNNFCNTLLKDSNLF